MDMRMPVMDGYEAVRQIRMQSSSDKLPIIAITASAFAEQRQEILAAGCDDMVFKPFQAHEIFQVMGRFLDIDYIYEQEDEALLVSEIELTSDLLKDLPAELLQELNKACLSLDTEAVLEAIKRIEPLAPDTAKALQVLLDDFQIGQIRDLIGETHAE
jgi:CheY-like chemotaxis protein